MGNCFAGLPVRIPPPLWESIRAGAPPTLRWFHRNDLHLTLAFLGPENPERLPVVHELLAGIPRRGFEIALGPLRLLPRPNRFSALSFEISCGAGPVSELIASWRNPLLEAAGRPRDDRPPYPHLTIARPDRKHPEYRPALLRRWARSLVPPVQPLEVSAPVLYGWSPDRPRRQFRIIEQ